MGNSPVPKHADDHHPDYGTDPLTFLGGGLPWAMLWSGATTAATGAFKPVPFSNAVKMNDDADTYFSWAQTETGDTGNPRWRLTLEYPGLYLFDLWIAWDNTPFNSVCALDLNMTDTNGALLNDPDELIHTDSIDGNYLIHNANQHMQGTILVLEQNGNDTATLDPQARQNSGSDKGLSGVLLRVVRLSDVSLYSGWTIDTVA